MADTTQIVHPVFVSHLMDRLITCVYSFHGDTYDADRFGPLSFRSRLIIGLKQWLHDAVAPVRVIVAGRTYSHDIWRLQALTPYLVGLSALYMNLADDASREVLIRAILLRMLDTFRVRMPVDTPAYHAQLKLAHKLADQRDQIAVSFMDWSLSRFDLSIVGFPIVLYYSPIGVLNTFLLRQYDGMPGMEDFSVRMGDVVIDGGGCWGDSALFFANQAGPTGQVFTFEFVPSNLAILERNLELNPALRTAITIVPHPLWSDSATQVQYTESGPGTRVGRTMNEVSGTSAETRSIDDLVAQSQIPRVDFLKLDIEGAELQALQGAIATIRKFRPRLAVSLYHSMDDFVEIPRWLLDLDLGYRFYLGHFTRYSEETVLFAAPAS